MECGYGRVIIWEVLGKAHSWLKLKMNIPLNDIPVRSVRLDNETLSVSGERSGPFNLNSEMLAGNSSVGHIWEIPQSSTEPLNPR